MKIQTKIHPTSEKVINEILELAHLCQGEQDVKKVLDLLVAKITTIMRSDVCSLYLIDPQTKELVLRATKGLNPSAVNRIRMRFGEGLVGKTMEWLKPVSIARGRKSRRFKYFPESGEEKFASFLSVPLIYNRQPIGVLAIQNQKPTRYSPQMVQLMMMLAIPVVNVIEKAKLLGTFGRIAGMGIEPEQRPAASENAIITDPHRQGIVYEGIAAAPGIALGTVKILDKKAPSAVPSKIPEPIHAAVEKMRVLEAFRWVEEETLEVQKKAKKKFGMEEVSIFDAYRMVLESEPFKEQILEEIDRGKSALKSVEGVIQKYTDELARADDEYIRERAYDIQDVGRKITDHLLYGSEVPKGPHLLEEAAILMSDFWSISDFVEMDLEKTQGILSPSGGASSHVAILAQSLGIPAVLGLGSFSDLIRDGDQLIMDGSTGTLIVNPAPQVRLAYERESRGDLKAQRQYQKSAKKPAVPIGGKRITIGANMGIVAHVHQAIDQGVEEVGLYRTEFPFLVRRRLPTEEEQYLLYRKILTAMGSRPVTIRTLDIGGDKHLPYLNLPKETNPFLGWRSIRISLEREDLFRIQLRALLRASKSGKLKILFPMISSVEEIRQVKEILKDVKRELTSENHSFAPSIPIGAMIEVPSAVAMASSLIKEVDFFSIGTNDLIQYTLAVDRNNAKVARMFNPLHPAILKSIQATVAAAHHDKKPVSVCGEMAGQPMGVILLAGMGVNSLSMSAPQIAKVKNLICRLNMAEIKKLTAQALKSATATEIQENLFAYMQRKGLAEFLPHAAPVL